MIAEVESDHGLISHWALVGGLPGSLPPPGVGAGAGAGAGGLVGAGAALPGAGAGAGGFIGAGAAPPGAGMPPCSVGGFFTGGNGPRILPG